MPKTFTYYGHATVGVTLADGRFLLIDPWVMSNPVCPEELYEFDRVDAILLTHGHFDHVDDAVEIARKYKPEKVVAALELCHWLETRGVENCAHGNLGGSQEVLGLKVTMVQAVHSSGVLDGDTFAHGGPAMGYVVRDPNGIDFYHAGDTALFSDMALIGEMYRPQLAFLPIGDVFTMDPVQAAKAVRMIGCGKAVPIHWGTFPALTGTPEQFEAEVKDRELNCEVITMQPGDTLKL